MLDNFSRETKNKYLKCSVLRIFGNVLLRGYCNTEYLGLSSAAQMPHYVSVLSHAALISHGIVKEAETEYYGLNKGVREFNAKNNNDKMHTLKFI